MPCITRMLHGTALALSATEMRVIAMFVLDTWRDGAGKAYKGLIDVRYKHVCTMCDAHVGQRDVTRTSMRSESRANSASVQVPKGQMFNEFITHFLGKCSHHLVAEARRKYLHASELWQQLGYVRLLASGKAPGAATEVSADAVKHLLSLGAFLRVLHRPMLNRDMELRLQQEEQNEFGPEPETSLPSTQSPMHKSQRSSSAAPSSRMRAALPSFQRRNPRD